ncbi:MAG: DUF4292 domain-containing protein [Bacteroidaceae bacterium]|nr:DUF4292 domain-containing protein [Bacteroidaceae bacterium]
MTYITHNLALILTPSKGGWRVLLLFCAFLAVSCGTKKQAVDSAGSTETSLAPLQNIVQTVNANRHKETYATAKINLALSSGDKSVSLGGTLRMKRNDVIQLSLVTLGILEVARIEVTPDYFMAIDKVGRQYIKAAFRDISFLKTAGIDFQTLQALFWNELFLLNGSGAAPTEKQFTKSMEGDRAKLVNADSRLAVLTFLVGKLTGIIQQTSVSPHSSGASPYLTWNYAEFGQLEGKYFPVRHLININSSKPIKATLSLSNLKNEGGWETRTEVSSRYKEITLEELLSRILKN